MLTHSEIKKGARIIIDGQPYEVLEASPLKKAQRRVVIQSKIRNLITGNVFARNFHQGDVFEEAQLTKIKVKFLYSHRNRYFFCEEQNPSKRFDLDPEQITSTPKFLKPNEIAEALVFEEKIINVSLPVKVQLKVSQAPPGVMGDRAQGGTKQVVLETGAVINTPLFIEQGNTIEINTEKGEYVRRVE